MKALIIDDERLARKELASLLAKYDFIDIVGEACDVDEAIELIHHHNPDVLFLDVQMPDRTGFELLENLDNPPAVVFTTAYDEFALKAFEVNATDYLLKPIQPERLEDSINKLRQENPTNLNNIDKNSRKLELEDQVFVKDGDKCWFVRLSKIRLFESDGNYIKVYFDNQKPMIHRSLNALDERLDQRDFFRVSRKHIINLNWIETIEPWLNGGLMVMLNGGFKVEVSRRQAVKFREKMSL